MSLSVQSMEHRWGTRVHLDAPAQLRVEGDITTGVTLRDASLSGAFIQMHARLPAMTRIWVRATEGGGEWLEACVVRHAVDGMGIEWCDPGLRAVCELLALRQEEPALRGMHPYDVTRQQHADIVLLRIPSRSLEG
jgi:hypothetical protein